MSELRDQLAAHQSPVGIFDGGAPAPPTEAELAVPIVAPGRPALLPLGIVYQAGWEPEADGMARHARAAVRALASTGLPVGLATLPHRKMAVEEDIDPGVLREVGYLRHVTFSEVAFAIRQLVIHSRQYLENVICPSAGRLAGIMAERSIYRSTIVYTSWERTTVSPDIVEVLNRVAEVWVPCEDNAEVFLKAGVERVWVLPCPYNPDQGGSRLAAPRGSDTMPAGRRFYAIGKWEPRKNYHALVGAFLQSFTPKDPASLLVKTLDFGGWAHYPTAEESLQYWLEDPAVRARGWSPETAPHRVRLVNAKLSEERLLELHRASNIYVSASHGEAWDLPAFEARAAGNRLVYSSWGGPRGFAGEGDVLIRADESRFEPVDSQYGWESDATWARVTVDAIRDALLRASPPELRRHPASFVSTFGHVAVGRRMQARLRELFPRQMVDVEAVGGYG